MAKKPTIPKHPSKRVIKDAAKDLPRKGKSKLEKEFGGSVLASAGKKKKS